MQTVLNRFLHSCLTNAARPSRHGRPARRLSPVRRLCVEHLEDRKLLSALSVTSGADSGPGSLRGKSPPPTAAIPLFLPAPFITLR